MAKSNVKTRTAGAKTPPPARPTTTVASGPPMNGPDRIAWFSLHALIVMVAISMANLTMSAWFNPPLFGGLPITYDQFDIIKVTFMRIFALTGVAAWGWGMLTKGGKLRTSKHMWVMLGFIAWVALATVFSIHPATALFGKYRRFEGLVSFVNYAAVLLLAVQYATRPSRIRSIARTIVLAGAAVALYGVMQAVGADFINWSTLPFEARRAFATYGNPDLLGGFLMFPLALSLAMAFAEERTVWRAIYWVAFLLTGACLFVSYVRGAWIGGFVSLAVLAFVMFRSKQRVTGIDKAFFALVLVAVLILTATSLVSTNEVMNVGKRIASIFKFGEGSALTRFQIWDAAISAIKDRPVFGFGPDTFRLVFPKYKPVEYVKAAGYLSVADNVHNYPLQLAAGVGIPGLILLYAFIVWVMKSSASSAFSRELPGDKLVYTGFWMTALAYVVHLFFGLSVTGSTVYLWLALGVLIAPFAKTRDFRSPAWGPAAALPLVLLAAAGIIGSIVFVQADRAYLMGRVREQGPARIEAVQKAIRLNPFNDMYRSELGLAHQDMISGYLTQAQQASQAGQAQQANEFAGQARESFMNAERAMLETIEFVPWEYDNYVFLSSLYNMGGQYFDDKYLQDAVDTAQKGIEVEPFGPAVRYQQATALYQLGKADQALKQLETAVGMDPAYMDAKLLMATIYTDKGRLEEAKALVQEALTTDLGWRKPQVEQQLAAIEASLAAEKK